MTTILIFHQVKKTRGFQVHCDSATKRTALAVCSVTAVKKTHAHTEMSIILPN